MNNYDLVDKATEQAKASIATLGFVQDALLDLLTRMPEDHKHFDKVYRAAGSLTLIMTDLHRAVTRMNKLTSDRDEVEPLKP
jgi:hypothetical protein